MTWDADTRRARLREALELSRSYRRYGSEVAAAFPMAAPSPAPVDQGAWYEQRTEVPAGSPSLVGDLAVPAAQALLSGGFASAAVAVARGAGLEVGAWVVLGAGVGVAGVVWSYLLSDGRRLLRSVVIESRGDAEQVAASPTPARDVLTVEVKESRPGSGPGWSLSDLPEGRDVLVAVCKAVASGARHLSRRDLVGIGGMGADRVRALLAALELRGFVTYPKGRNDPGGAVWTAKGRALSRALIG
ncbi:MAG: hypothetical protein BWY79_01774 [Actinobacteria bacterium ADurb.Bin444]|nr:MAG: hypothetical protein BWY79_01774 [Actinobacteria bacterium ADurb.Bin444]